MTFVVDQPCEVHAGGRWHAAVVVSLEGTTPRVRVVSTGKLVRCAPSKIRQVHARPSVRGGAMSNWTDPTDDTREVRAPAPPAAPTAELHAQPKPRTPRDPRFLDHLRSRPCDHCRAPPRSEAAHFGPDRGVALKASDYEACSLCSGPTGCHAHWHLHGALPGLDREKSMLVQWRGAVLALLTYRIATAADADFWRALALVAGAETERRRR